MGGAGSYLVAFGGGLVSFLSPCVLPLVPVYLSMITGLEVAEIQEGARVHAARIARDTGGFIAGFSAVFILLGLSATTLGRAAFANRAALTRISGLIVVAMALFLVGSLVLKAPWLFTEKRFHPRVSRFGRLAAPVTGAAFGFGWTPCIGPVLTSVLAIAATQGQAARGALLMAAYSIGLGIPFPGVGTRLRPAQRRFQVGETPLHRYHACLVRHPRCLRGRVGSQSDGLADLAVPQCPCSRRPGTPDPDRMNRKDPG